MKLNMGKPIVAVLILALIGVIGCADNPMTSAGENAESGRSESAGEHRGNANGEGHEGREGSEGGAGRLVANQGGDGGGEHGSGEGGGEGNETSGHAEGPEGGGGDPSSPILALDESFDGVVNGVRVAMSYDPVRRSFSGIVENTMALTACSVQIELNLKQGTRTVVELGPSPVGDLAPGASATTELLVDDEPQAAGVAFDAWEIHPEVFDCNCPVPTSSSGEGSEGGDIAQQLAPDQSYDQTRNGARLTMSYSPSQDAFYGIVENTTNQTLTRVRVEIHLTDQSGAIIAELGPTTPTDLAPGGRLLINLSAAGQTFAGWSPHAEVGSGEGGEGGGGEGGGEHGSGAGGGEGGGEHGSGAGGGEGGESHAGSEGGSG
ncbi:MAG: FxLYD domain-containing protein [Gemmatimonadetes bacterium]|nr:FxLYD domain-containing protein [Gemmatimonadota bacterium]